MISYIALAIASLLAASSAAVAQTNTVCSSPRTTNDVIACFETYHPDMRKIEANPTLIEGYKRQASQFPNPTISVQTVKGKNLGDVVGEDQLALSQLIEIGGKRSARAKLGSARSDLVRAEELSLRSQVRMNAVLSLVKYRQLMSEIAVLDEALQTYDKVQRTFSSRPRLSPDQQVTSGLFKLAVGDYRHRLAALQSEKLKAETFFRLVPEFNLSRLQALLPQRLEKWPKFSSTNADISAAPIFREAEANFKQAEATEDLEKAIAVPDPTISLVAVRQVDGATEYNQFGVAVSIGLPIFNWNGGAKRQATALRAKSEIDFKRTAAQVAIDRYNLLNSYQGFVNSLELAPKAKDLDIKHRNTESLYYRGVVSGVLMIESHRQMLDFTQSQNELEYETVQALLNLYLIDGRLGDFKYGP